MHKGKRYYIKTVKLLQKFHIYSLLIVLKSVFEMLYAGHSMKEKYLHRQLSLYQNKQYAKLKEKLCINVPVRPERKYNDDKG